MIPSDTHIAPRSCGRCGWWQQRGILLRMRQENLFGAFGAISIFSVRCCGFSTERSTPFWYFLERDERVWQVYHLTLWILVEFAGSSDEDIFKIKVRTKREKRPKTWSLRFDLLTIKMCTWDYKPWRLVLRCWCLTSMNHEVMCGGDREIFVTIIEGSLQFDLILLQLWNKIALSSRWPPSFKSLQIKYFLLSLCGTIGHKA